MWDETKYKIERDLYRVLNYANEDEELQTMCRNCEQWCGEKHDYHECLDKPCFTFYRCYAYLDLLNS